MQISLIVTISKIVFSSHKKTRTAHEKKNSTKNGQRKLSRATNVFKRKRYLGWKLVSLCHRGFEVLQRVICSIYYQSFWREFYFLYGTRVRYRKPENERKLRINFKWLWYWFTRYQRTNRLFHFHDTLVGHSRHRKNWDIFFLEHAQHFFVFFAQLV